MRVAIDVSDHDHHEWYCLIALFYCQKIIEFLPFLIHFRVYTELTVIKGRRRSKGKLKGMIWRARPRAREKGGGERLHGGHCFPLRARNPLPLCCQTPVTQA